MKNKQTYNGNDLREFANIEMRQAEDKPANKGRLMEKATILKHWADVLDSNNTYILNQNINFRTTQRKEHSINLGSLGEAIILTLYHETPHGATGNGFDIVQANGKQRFELKIVYQVQASSYDREEDEIIIVLDPINCFKFFDPKELDNFARDHNFKERKFKRGHTKRNVKKYHKDIKNTKLKGILYQMIVPQD